MSGRIGGRGERERVCCLTSTEDKVSERIVGRGERERVCCLTSTEASRPIRDGDEWEIGTGGGGGGEEE